MYSFHFWNIASPHISVQIHRCNIRHQYTFKFETNFEHNKNITESKNREKKETKYEIGHWFPFPWPVLKIMFNNYSVLRWTMAEIQPITLTHTQTIVFDYGLLAGIVCPFQ